MATAVIDCRAYYIDRETESRCCVYEQSSRQLCRNPRDNHGDSGCGFSVSKYLIDRPATEVEQNSSASANISRRSAGNVVDGAGLRWVVLLMLQH